MLGDAAAAGRGGEVDLGGSEGTARLQVCWLNRWEWLFRTLKKLNPAKLRDKRPWEINYSLAVLE